MFRFDLRVPSLVGATLISLGGCATSTRLLPPQELVVARAGVPLNAIRMSTDEMILNPEGFFLARETQIVEEFLDRCEDKAVGCAISVVGPTGLFAGGGRGDARRAPDTKPRKLTEADKITMASVSKTFTGTALQKLLFDRGICLDTAIGPYLPKHWQVTEEFAAITFRQLLTHTSGLHCTNIDYPSLKTCAATARPCPSTFWYVNENFALMRILIPEIEGIDPGLMKPLVLADQMGNWGPISKEYAARHIAYVNKTVFGPAGFPAVCKPTDALPALSYKSTNPNDRWDFTTVGPGEIWGDMTEVCGSQGWFLSAHEMAQAMRAIMTPDKILVGRNLDEMKAGQLAVYFGDHGNGLQSWHHGGWHPAEWNLGEINTLVVHFNNGLSAGVIINSPYGSNGQGGDFFADLVAAVQAAN